MQDFNDEYAARRTVLGRRLDVTIQAFLGSAKAEDQVHSINKVVSGITFKDEAKSK